MSHSPYEILHQNDLLSLPYRSLLFLMLRQSLLLTYREAALDILEEEAFIDPSVRKMAGSAPYFRTYSPFLGKLTIASKWNFLFHDIDRVDGLYQNEFPRNAFWNYLHTRSEPQAINRYLYPRGGGSWFTGFSQHSRHLPLIQPINQMEADLQALRDIPTARLDYLLSEHLDLCSYRLDAWLLGLVHRRLDTQRHQQPQGLHLGAFGWLEDLRPGGARDLAKDVPAELAVGNPRIYTDADNQGFIHAPSLNHAVTAAILRAGYLAHAEQGEASDLSNRMAINLASARVRAALFLLEGIRNGQDLGALLGYMFERGLHENHPGVELDQYIYPLRRRFPLDAEVDEDISQAEVPNQVIHGLDLLESVQAVAEGLAGGEIDTLYEVLKAHEASQFGRAEPFGLDEALWPPTAAGREAFFRELDRLADAFDALSDLALSESVYQIARGNFARAASMVNALAEGKRPPEPEIVHPPRDGVAVTQRVSLHLEPIVGG
ncbi:MAG: hypothetical protein D6722_05885, partial [Bacteroidetes bacterium]